MTRRRHTTTRDAHRRTIAKNKPPCAYEQCLFPGEPIDYDTPNHLDPKAFTVDHTIPLAHGGPDTLANKEAMHRACNRDKADKLPEQVGVDHVTHRRWW